MSQKWLQLSNRGLGGTGTSDTGTSVDHTLGTAAGYYVYTESSDPNYPDKTAQLLMPYFDISSLTQPVMGFWYHMYGASMGALHIDVYDGAVWQSDVILAISGAQGDAWHYYTVDLSTYSGVIQIRFRGVTNGFRSDMAIDDVLVTNGPSISTLSPDSGPSTGGTSVTITGTDFGSSQGSGSVTFGGTPAASYTSWTDTEIICASPAHNPGDVDVVVTRDDGLLGTDSSGFSYYAAAPYFEDFEEGGTLPDQ